MTGAVYHDSHARTISLDTPRKAIIYLLVCVGCLAGSLMLAYLGLLALSRFG